MAYIWYCAYGSNLHAQRFMCYITGGRPCFGVRDTDGCADKAPPLDSGAIEIHHPLYFALPNGRTKTGNWGAGGVAFIGPQEESEARTLCRIWKITETQYCEIKRQEGPSYEKQLELGERDGLPVLTFTHQSVLTNILRPSDAYIKTIALGLRETHGMAVDDIVAYLAAKRGIDKNLPEDALAKLLAQLPVN